MNNDLISRKYVVKELLKEREQFPAMVAERYSFGVKLPHSFNQAMRGGIRKGLRIVETAPAVDAEPVRHGAWKYEGFEGDVSWQTDGRGDCWRVFRCSECGVKKCGGTATNYCPNCGAKMDADVEG